MFLSPAPLQSNTQDIWGRRNPFNMKLLHWYPNPHLILKSPEILSSFQMGVIFQLLFLLHFAPWIYFWLSAFIHPLQAKVNGVSIKSYFAWSKKKFSRHVQKKQQENVLTRNIIRNHFKLLKESLIDGLWNIIWDLGNNK